MIRVHCGTQPDWREIALAALGCDGACIVEGMLAEPLLSQVRPAMYRARDAIQRGVGEARLLAAGELGVLRLKRQIDYVRAVGEEAELRQAPRTRQLLGYYTRVVASLDEYYRPEHERLYRKGQG